MLKSNVEKQVKDFYDSEGWVVDNDGKLTEHILFRDIKGGLGAYGEKLCLKPLQLLQGFSGTLLIIGGGDLPFSHMRAVESFRKVVCVDISQRALNLSKEKLRDKGLYYNASVLDLPLPDDSVDAVLCAHMLFHVDRFNQLTAVNEMIRVTKEGGRILIIYSNPHAPLMLIQRLLKLLHINTLLGKAKFYFYSYSPKWWKNFQNRCDVTILPYNAISTNQAKALLPTFKLRRKFYQWALKFEDRHPDLAARLWSYITVLLDKNSL